MKKYRFYSLALVAALTYACNSPAPENKTEAGSTTQEAPVGGQEAVQDNDSQKDVVKIAIGSADHTTLVAALKQADLVTVLSNAGPFTVFAPTNEAFNKLPKGTVEDLMKPENKAKLQDILEYHVSVGVFKPEMFQDGQTINQANSKNISLSVKDGKIMVNNQANIIASIPAANGIIHVIDAVLVPTDH
ncbi:MAG: fasciclin domain-containing protein [Bacteroidetes bacterium]|jgi:uncharacterized surface protein with fasciclin (FAS1) repeats|nr:fasciclin domain-containing protein [Bacteroidota bacterium]